MEDTIGTEPLEPRSTFFSTRWIIITLLVIVASLVGGLCAYKLRGSPVERGSSALVDAFRSRRLIEPRLSGGFIGATFNPSVDDRTNINWDKLACAGDLIRDSLAKGDLSAQHPYARLLLLSDQKKLPEALKYLRRAVASAPESAEAHNDLGVCLILQGKLEDAIDEFDVSLNSRADMPEALFNRALCYEQLLLRDAASAEYTRASTIEREPNWLSEIKRRQEDSSAQIIPKKKEGEIVSAFDAAVDQGKVAEAKQIADENWEILIKNASYELPMKYLEESLGGNSVEAERTLARLDLLGKHFLDMQGDSSITELGDYLRKLLDSEKAVELRLLKEFVEAENLFVVDRYGDAEKAFENLGNVFAKRGNEVFQDFATFYTCSCRSATGQLVSSIEMTQKALSNAQRHRWRYSQAQLSIQLGIAYSRLGYDSRGIKYFEEALQSARALYLLRGKALQYMGNAYWHLGELVKGLDNLRASTRSYLASVPARSELAYNHLQIADIYRIRGNHSLALLYAKQATSFLNKTEDNNRAAQTSSFIAVEHARLGEREQAERELSQAFGYIERTEQGQRSYTEALVLTRAGEMAALQPNTERAVAYYSKAEALIANSEEKATPLLEVLRGRAETYTQAKQFDKARLDLERAIDSIEGYRAGISEKGDRRAYLDARQGVFDQLISLNIGVFGRRAEAFDLAEQSRGRTLLDELFSGKALSDSQKPGASTDTGRDLLLNRQAEPLRLADVQAGLPDDLRLLAYSVTDQRTYIFLVTRSGFEVAESPATTGTLDQLVQAYVSDLRKAGAVEEQASALYEQLIAPVEGKLGDGKTLCIVPDKALHLLPFAALVDRSRRYLLESYRLTYAASASVLVRCVQEARAKGEIKDEKILAVGNPRFDRDAFPTLNTLPDAEREARESASSYSDSLVLKGSEATEERVKAALKDCDVAHLAVHCLVQEKSPWLAALVLGKEPTGLPGSASGSQTPPDDGLLYLNEIYKISLPRTRLIVLSACQSGLGQYYRGEGIVSLIHPFLALRVPTVVASLWSVDSQATAALMIDFHQERKNSRCGAADALRAAQIKMIQSGSYSHPYYWAPFIAVGSNN